MNSGKVLILTAVAGLSMAGCAVQRYKASPIAPVEMASRLQARTLSDADLRDYIAGQLRRNVEPWPPPSWDPELLTLAAFYFNSQLVTARARVETAQAAVTTAAARPNPTLNVSPGIPKPYLLTLDFSIPVETHGKRDIRTEQGQHLSDAARFDLAATAWEVRSQVRLALLNYLVAQRRLALLREEQNVLAEQVRLIEARLAVGEIPRPEVDTARIALVKDQVAIPGAQGKVGETLAALAATIGVPSQALAQMQVSWPALDSPPDPAALSPSMIQRDAVLNRLDLRRTLAQYAASEDGLRLEIVRQYPDFNIGPGYAYEEMNNFFTVGLSSTLPIFNRNQGPIAEAEARRKEAAANVLSVQAQGISQSEVALELYRAAFDQLRQTRQALLTLQTQREGMHRRAVLIGESDQLSLNGILLERSVAAGLEIDALAQLQTALGALEDAVQRPVDPSWELPELSDPAHPDSRFLERGIRP